MPKLHELLAVDGQLKGQATAARTDLHNTFTKKPHHFTKRIREFVPVEDGRPAEREEQLDLQTTVPQELSWLQSLWAKALDISFAVADANMVAKADLVLEDGTTLLPGCPATALLELEKRAGEIQELVTAIPTLDPAKGFVPDPDSGTGVYKAREVVKVRTKKTSRAIVLYPATPEHPAQAQLVPEDVETGKVREQEWSSMLTVKEKGDMLERCEALRRAIKQARTRANAVDLDKPRAVGEVLLGYVFKNGNGKV